MSDSPTPESREPGREVVGMWYLEPAMGGAATVLQVGAGAGGGPGLVAEFELREHAEWAVKAWNRAHLQKIEGKP